MYTIVVDNKNYMHTSIYEQIAQKSNLSSTIKILVPRQYNDFNMDDFDVVLEYKTPESGNVGSISLSEYKILENGYIEFFVPIGINMTNEPGDVKILLTFTKMESDGSKSVIVRKVGPTDVMITPIGDWNGDIPEEEVSAIDQKIAELKEAIDDVKKEKADNLSYEDNVLQLTSNDIPIGDKISLQNQDIVWKEI